MVKILMFSRLKARIPVNTHDKTIYVLANGPSTHAFLKNPPIELASSKVLCMNFALLDDHIFKVEPDAYIVSDPNVFGKGEVLEVVYDKYVRLVEILNKLDWNMILYVPFDFRSGRFVKDIKNNKIRICWFNRTPLVSSGRLLVLFYRLGLGLPKAESVIVAALGLAILNKPDTIKLVGVEHDWVHNLFVNEYNQVFYLLNHFYKGDKEYRSDLTMSDFMLSQHRLFKSHERIRYLSDELNVKVINMTRTSLIDCYERN